MTEYTPDTIIMIHACSKLCVDRMTIDPDFSKLSRNAPAEV